MHNIHSSAAVRVDPFSTIGIGLPDWLGLNTYDDAYMRLKKIAIADPPTKRRGYDDYYLITVFDIRIAINARRTLGNVAEIQNFSYESPRSIYGETSNE